MKTGSDNLSQVRPQDAGINNSLSLIYEVLVVEGPPCATL
jgi:hypothetical protein